MERVSAASLRRDRIADWYPGTVDALLYNADDSAVRGAIEVTAIVGEAETPLLHGQFGPLREVGPGFSGIGCHGLVVAQTRFC